MKILFTLIIFIVSSSQSLAQTNSAQCENRLEGQLSELPDFLKAPRVIEENQLPIECISSAMDTFYDWTLSVKLERRLKKLPEIGHYTYCENDSETQPLRLHTPPCQTQTYLSTIQNSYNDVLQCLDLNPLEIFPITAVESGFHINSVSLTNDDIGLGQITPIAANDVNTVWDFAVTQVSGSSKASCQRLAPLVAELSKSQEPESYTCSLTTLPMNPVKNLLYLVFLHQKNVQYIDLYFDSAKIVDRVQKLTQVEWSQAEVDSLKKILITLSYNVGNNAAIELFNEFLSLKAAPIQALNNEIESLKSIQIQLFLDIKSFDFQGKENEAQRASEARLQNQKTMDELQSQLDLLMVPRESFSISTQPQSFGYFLTNIKRVYYLNVLKDRIKYIEETILKKPHGYCSIPDYLNIKKSN